MLNFSKMLSVEHDHELFQFLCVNPPQEHQNMAPQGGLITLMPNKVEPAQPKSSRKRKSTGDNESPEDYGRRIIHRDVERHRRKEMATLYTKLRSLVPEEYIQEGSVSIPRKERRSISDDMYGAVNYINHLKTKVDELKNKRDELQKLMKFSVSSSGSCNRSNFSHNHDNISVIVQGSNTGMQVILKTSSVKGLPLSKFLRVLNDEGMAVTSCISTRVDEGQIYVIESEMDSGKIIDQTELQKRLRDLVYDP